MRDTVSKQGKAYDRIVKELDRDQFREYVLSVRHKPAGDAQPEAILSDWLPICEVVVADRQQYEVRRRRRRHTVRRRCPRCLRPTRPTRLREPVPRHRSDHRLTLDISFDARRSTLCARPRRASDFSLSLALVPLLPAQARKYFKENGMDIPRRSSRLSPPSRSRCPRDSRGTSFPRRRRRRHGARHGRFEGEGRPVDELEFGVEDWGSFENAVDGLEAQAGAAAGRAAVAAVLGVSPDDEPADIKRVYRKLIATEHPDRNPDRLSVSTPSRRRTS